MLSEFKYLAEYENLISKLKVSCDVLLPNILITA